MTAVTADENGPSNLGVLEQAVGVDADIEAALVVLGELGLSNPSRELRNAVSVALMHSSYLYESRIAFPGITKGLLDALSNLGLAFFRRLATVDAYKRVDWTTAGALSRYVAEISSSLPDWAAEQAWLLQCAALGHTFAEATPPAKVSANLLRQIVGVLCLAGKETVASRMLEGLLSDVRRRSTMVHDPKTALELAIAPATAEYSYEREGPDHQIVFQATVEDTQGRRGTGVGRTKKLAAQNAALDFLETYIPQALSIRIPEAVPHLTRVAIPQPRAHVLAIQRLQNLFGLPTSTVPLLSQALIHSSWAYEHHSNIIKYHQQDNQVLGFVGSVAATYEDALAAAQQIVTNPIGEFAFRGLDNETYNSLFRHTGLATGMLLGAGQVTKSITEEMGATTFQAVFGAVFIAKDFPDSLAPFWPRTWAPMWHIIASKTPRTSDPTTLLQEAASAMRLQTEYEFSYSGPRHNTLYRATLILRSETLGIHTQTIGPPAPTKVRAKHEVSTAVLAILDRLAQPDSVREMVDGTSTETRLARFVLAHQVALLATSAVPLQRWIPRRFFGLHLAASPTLLISWAEGVDRLLDSRNTIQAPDTRLEEVFRAVLEGAFQDETAIDTYLARILNTLEGISVPEDLSQEHLDQLVQLSGVYRCIGADEPDTDLYTLADDWQILYRGRLAISSVTNARLTSRERAVLDAAISAVLLPGTTATMDFSSTRPLRVQIVWTTGPTPRVNNITEICALWSGISKSTTLSSVEQGIEVTIYTTELPAQPGPITTTILAALKPRPEPYQASVADLLHDLKNQVVAARQASAQPTENETGRLEQQLDARRHLDKAHAIILQLKAVTSLLEPTSNKNVSLELGSFLRRYARTVFGWLPAVIALSTPSASYRAHVAIDDHALTAILDNLVKNATEAMPGGGSISLSWAADSYEAVIEIADDGPGLPSGITQALVSGQRIYSIKPGGSGLGLLGVRSLLRRVGGQLSAAPVTSGTAWEISLPIASTPNSEES